ncbi:MAG: GNAT family N-acetyltransferase [Inquilinus sp.]|nr:GNAT family N-acetyltransferase [Inquilinus sp.]
MKVDGPMTAVRLRAFEPVDGDRCAAIYLAGRRVAFPWVPPERFAAADFDRDTVDEEISVAVAGDGTILGFVSVYRSGSFVHHLYVDPGRRGQGIGRVLLHHAVASLPAPRRLKCVIANRPAMEFYRRAGWVEEERGEDDLGPYATLEF